MTVKLRKWNDPETGQARSAWCYDYTHEFPDRTTARQRKGGFDTKREAEDAEKQRYVYLENAFRAGTHLSGPVPTLAAFVKRFNDEAAQQNKPSTQTQKESSLRRVLLPRWGETPLDRIDTAAVDALRTELLTTRTSRGTSPAASTVNGHLRVLSRLLHLAHERGDLKALPHIEMLPEPRPDDAVTEDMYLSFEEADRLLAAATGLVRSMILLDIRTGLRIGELRALQWDSVDLPTGVILVRRSVHEENEGSPKSGRMRTVPLARDAWDALKAVPRGLHCPYVFPVEGRRMTYAEAVWLLHTAAKDAGIEKLQRGFGGWHSLRHTFASHAVQKGVSIYELQELLGHSDIKLTKRYAHLSPTVKRAAVALLGGE